MDKLRVTTEQVEAVERNLIRHKGGPKLGEIGVDYEIVDRSNAQPISGWYRPDSSLFIFIDIDGGCHT